VDRALRAGYPVTMTESKVGGRCCLICGEEIESANPAGIIWTAHSVGCERPHVSHINGWGPPSISIEYMSDKYFYPEICYNTNADWNFLPANRMGI
jgi:hypothetical protein